MAKMLYVMHFFLFAILFSGMSQASIIPPLNGTYVLVEQNGTCFSRVTGESAQPMKLAIFSNETKLLPAYVMEDGLKHVINYSMNVGIFDQIVFGGAGIYRRVGEYSPNMRIFIFSEYSLPRQPTGLEKPQSVTVFELDSEDALTVSEAHAGWMCKFIRK